MTTATESPAFVDGRTAGRLDKMAGRRSDLMWATEPAPGATRDYSLGYHEGWDAQLRAETLARSSIFAATVDAQTLSEAAELNRWLERYNRVIPPSPEAVRIVRAVRAEIEARHS